MFFLELCSDVVTEAKRIVVRLGVRRLCGELCWQHIDRITCVKLCELTSSADTRLTKGLLYRAFV